MSERITILRGFIAVRLEKIDRDCDDAGEALDKEDALYFNGMADGLKDVLAFIDGQPVPQRKV